jgi:hypothetical protein
MNRLLAEIKAAMPLWQDSPKYFRPVDAFGVAGTVMYLSLPIGGRRNRRVFSLQLTR